jgi:hypothetical protein
MKTKTTLFAVSLATVAASSYGQTSRGVSPEERQALVALFRATGGGTWQRADKWLGAPGTECEWYGITCGVDASQGKPGPLTVKAIVLRNNNLVGEVTKPLSGLVHVDRVALTGNAVTGRLSGELLERWDAGLVSVEPTSLVTAIEKLVIVRSSPALVCSGYRASLTFDGSVVRTVRKCGTSASDGDGTCVASVGTTADFARVGRFLERTMADKKAADPIGASDETRVRIDVTVEGRNRTLRYGLSAVSLSEWAMGAAVEGTVSSATWSQQSERPCTADNLAAFDMTH